MVRTKTWTALFLVLLACGFVTSFAHAQEASELRIKPSDLDTGFYGKRFNGEWNFEIGGDSFGEGKDEGAAAFTYFRANFEWRFNSWLKAVLRPRLDLYTSRLQERYDNDEYENRIRLTEGYLSLKPVSWGEARAGAIGQEFMNSPMLVSSARSFPGGQLRASWSYGSHKFEAIAQQVVPTSYSLDTDRQDREQLPWFATQSLYYTGRNFNFLEWKVNGGHYTWANVPDKIAFQSAQLGNSVIGDTAPGARMKYMFDGFFGGLEVCACFVASPVQMVGEFQRVHNSMAPNGMGDAQMWGIGPRLVFGDRVLDVRYRRYFNESDTTVAMYSRSMLGNTNRIGDNLEFRLEFKDMKFAVLGEWVGANTLHNSPTQFTMNAFYIGVETNYESF